MNATTDSGNRSALLVLTLVIVSLLAFALVAFTATLVAGNMWMAMGGMMNGGMMSMDGQVMNEMISACADMMKKFPQP